MKPSRSERAIARETAIHISSLAKHNKKANLRRELALLHATPDPRFHGEIIIEPRQDAIRTAKATKNSEPDDESLQLVFFVDGSRFTNIKDKKNRKAPESGKGKAAGAAVVWETHDDEWERRAFCLADGFKPHMTEMAAIAEGLAIALSQILLLHNGQLRGNAKVIIFSDCQAAMLHLDKIQRTSPSESRLHGDPIVRKIVTRSQYLRGLGVEVEIRWVPAHATVPGNIIANATARCAAWRVPGIAEPVYLDEGLRIIELELAEQEGSQGMEACTTDDKSLIPTSRTTECLWCQQQHLGYIPTTQMDPAVDTARSPSPSDATPYSRLESGCAFL